MTKVDSLPDAEGALAGGEAAGQKPAGWMKSQNFVRIAFPHDVTEG